ncbi:MULTISPECIES: hypothetical protein [unclassified Ruegeria]|uniref:hypothetical protein n=1 Tax=unclassified Ruegeria TaxID=2625375 RepID=UPI001491169E|nr:MULTISPECIES: hypothetical protein [unclassified Ruegeria]NOD47346.1 hypothetical protein [Ruegeria sp. HKCCD5849]NOD53261.1 hypothetical protein [Ruegeria sp. HKCCD5851]NOD66454.1 hypothetical protein [Ruegeria sp. HKCCD7303]
MPYFERKPYENPSRVISSVASQPDTQSISNIARRVLETERGNQKHLEGPFTCRKICHPGDTATILLSFAAAEGDEPVEMQFEPGDLTNPNGDILPANRVNVIPPQIRLASGEATDVAVVVTVPDLTEPGAYHGRIACTGTEQTSIVVVFEVAGAQT